MSKFWFLGSWRAWMSENCGPPTPLGLLYFTHVSQRESFVHLFHTSSFLQNWSIFELVKMIQQQHLVVGRRMDGQVGAKTLMSSIKRAASPGLRGSNKPVPSYCNSVRGRFVEHSALRSAPLLTSLGLQGHSHSVKEWYILRNLAESQRISRCLNFQKRCLFLFLGLGCALYR